MIYNPPTFGSEINCIGLDLKDFPYPQTRNPSNHTVDMSSHNQDVSDGLAYIECIITSRHARPSIKVIK